MKRWGALLLSLFALQGCSGSDDSAPARSDDHWGGQTGSLVPACDFARSELTVAPVAAGDSAFVYYDGQCQTAIAAGDIRIVGPDGEQVPATLEPLENGATLVRADVALAPGVYRVEAGELGTMELEVAEPEQLPLDLGTLSTTSVDGCLAVFDLHWDARALPYLSLMKLEVSIDGRAPQTWAHFGRLEAVDGRTELRLWQCDGGCAGTGRRELRVSATIAGEELQPEPLETQFDLNCPRESGGLGCATQPSAWRNRYSATWLLCCSVGLFAWRRYLRSRRRPSRDDAASAHSLDSEL